MVRVVWVIFRAGAALELIGKKFVIGHVSINKQ